MKIALDGIFLENLNCGTGQYCYHLIKGLNIIDRENDYQIYSPFEYSLDFKLNRNFQWRQIKINNFGRNLNKVFWEQFYIPAALGQNPADLFHAPYMVLPHRKKARKYLVTIHDVIGYRFRKYREKLKWRLYYWLIKKVLKKADGVITVSEFSRKEINEVLKIEDSSIKVIYGSVFIPENLRAADQVKKKYNLKRNFILSVSRPDPRKNTGNLIKAYKMSRVKDHYDLVIINGEYFSKTENVFFLHDIPKEDLALLYLTAEFMVYPSLYEGFGLPVLEAMEYGCPVIASNTSSVPEILGDAGILVSSYFPESITSAMESLMDNQQLRKNLVSKGKERAGKFSWLKMAEETREYYKLIGSAE